jgi:hypothetical protein
MADISHTLAAIDSAINDRCGCGCGRRLDPDGPSPHFATPECQRGWHEDRTHNPHEVYRRADPIITAPARTAHRPPSPAAIRWLALWGFEREAVEAVEGWPAGGAEAWFYDLLAYRRRCEQCGTRAQPNSSPRTVEPGQESFLCVEPGEELFLWYMSRRVVGEIVQRCPNCGTMYDGPILIGHVELTADEIQLSLTDGAARIEDTIPYTDLVNGPHLCRLLQHTWSALEDALATGPGLPTWWAAR